LGNRQELVGLDALDAEERFEKIQNAVQQIGNQVAAGVTRLGLADGAVEAIPAPGSRRRGTS